MSATGLWAGLSDSVFLTGINERERDPARLAGAVLGGALVGLVAAVCLLVLILVAYALMAGQGEKGLDGVVWVTATLRNPKLATPAVEILRLLVATAVDGIFLLALVAFAAKVVAQPLIVYVTAARRIRWRLLAMSFVLSTAAMAPLVAAERILAVGGGPPPFMALSELAADRVVYALSALLLIPAAAAEELFFRGWLLRRIGVFLRRPQLLIVLSALAFAGLHFDFDPDVFLTRTLMGAGFAYMTLRLGGIEFSTGAHAVNNVLIVLFLQPLDMQSSAHIDISGFSLVEDLALVGGYVLITELVARSAVLRRLAGVRQEELSVSGPLPGPFGRGGPTP